MSALWVVPGAGVKSWKNRRLKSPLAIFHAVCSGQSVLEIPWRFQTARRGRLFCSPPNARTHACYIGQQDMDEHTGRPYASFSDDILRCALPVNIWTTISGRDIRCRRQPGLGGVHVLCFPRHAYGSLVFIINNDRLPQKLDDIHERRTVSVRFEAEGPQPEVGRQHGRVWLWLGLSDMPAGAMPLSTRSSQVDVVKVTDGEMAELAVPLLERLDWEADRARQNDTLMTREDAYNLTAEQNQKYHAYCEQYKQFIEAVEGSHRAGGGGVDCNVILSPYAASCPPEFLLIAPLFWALAVGFRMAPLDVGDAGAAFLATPGGLTNLKNVFWQLQPGATLGDFDDGVAMYFKANFQEVLAAAVDLVDGQIATVRAVSLKVVGCRLTEGDKRNMSYYRPNLGTADLSTIGRVAVGCNQDAIVFISPKGFQIGNIQDGVPRRQAERLVGPGWRDVAAPRILTALDKEAMELVWEKSPDAVIDKRQADENVGLRYVHAYFWQMKQSKCKTDVHQCDIFAAGRGLKSTAWDHTFTPEMKAVLCSRMLLAYISKNPEGRPGDGWSPYVQDLIWTMERFEPQQLAQLVQETRDSMEQILQVGGQLWLKQSKTKRESYHRTHADQIAQQAAPAAQAAQQQAAQEAAVQDVLNEMVDAVAAGEAANAGADEHAAPAAQSGSFSWFGCSLRACYAALLGVGVAVPAAPAAADAGSHPVQQFLRELQVRCSTPLTERQPAAELRLPTWAVQEEA